MHLRSKDDHEVSKEMPTSNSDGIDFHSHDVSQRPNIHSEKENGGQENELLTCF